MRYDWEEHTLLTVHNFSPKPRAITLERERAGGDVLVNLLTRDDSRIDEQRRHRIELDAYGYRWFRTGGIDRNVARP